MNGMFYLSRTFVEFGPFSSSELLDFKKRGIIRDSDYVRPHGGDDWTHVNDWVDGLEVPAAPKAAPKAAPAAKKVAAKKAPAKKAVTAKKAAKK